MKRLLLSVTVAALVHAVMLSADFSWLKTGPRQYPKSEVIILMLSANKVQKHNTESMSLPSGQIFFPDSPPFSQPQVKQLKPVFNEIIQRHSTRIVDPALTSAAPQGESEAPPPSPKPIEKKAKPIKGLKALTQKMHRLKPIEMTQAESAQTPISEWKVDEKKDGPSPPRQALDGPPLPTDSAVTRKVFEEAHGSSELPTTSTETHLKNSQEIASESASIHNPAPLSQLNTPPKYPSKAQRMGYEGIVILKILVGEDGRVRDFEIFQPSGYSILDDAAVSAVKKWLFKPGTKNGQKIAMWVKVPVRFKLDE